MNIGSIPLDVLLYNIMTNEDLTPPDVLGLCQQPGFVLLCKLPKVGRAFMNRYYPNITIDINDPWQQFKKLAMQTEIRYLAWVREKDIADTENDKRLFNVIEMNRDIGTWDESGEFNIYVDIYGVPISGERLIGGVIDRVKWNHKYQIYETKEKAMKDLWEKLGYILDRDNDPERRHSYGGQIRYRSPVDYRETYEGFRQELLEKGYSLYHYYETFEDERYGDYSDYSDYGTIIFSIHNVVFNN